MISELQARVTAFLAKHSRKIMTAGGGVLLGLLLLMCMYWVVDLLLTPATPDVRSVSAQAVASFIANPRGFARMPLNDKRKMLFDLCSSDPNDLEELSDEFARLSSSERDQVRGAAMDVALDQLVRDAKVYRRLDLEDRDEFVENVLERFEELQDQLRDIGDSFKDDLPTKSDQWTKSLVTRTTPKQRSLIKPLVDHISKAAEKRRKQARELSRRRSRRR